MRPYSGAPGDLETFRCRGEFQTPIQEYPCPFHLLCETPVQGKSVRAQKTGAADLAPGSLLSDSRAPA